MHPRPTLNRSSSTSTEEQLRQLLALDSTDPSTSSSSSSWIETLSLGTVRLSKGRIRGVIPVGLVGGNAHESDDVVVKGGTATPHISGGNEETNNLSKSRMSQYQVEKEAGMRDLVSKILYEVPPSSDHVPNRLASFSDPEESNASLQTIVIAPCFFPPSSEFDHSILMRLLLEKFETLLNKGEKYSAVLLASPSLNVPSTPLLISSYLSLSSPVRKNIKQIFIVNGGWWASFILKIFTSTLLSRKTQAQGKIVQCSSLSDLATQVGKEVFLRIEIPYEVYIANNAVEEKITVPSSDSRELMDTDLSRVFGFPIDQSTSRVPRAVKDCLDLLAEEGPMSEGIFRRSPSAAGVKILQSAYDRGHAINLSLYPDAPFLAASLLKSFLRLMPDPIFPSSLFDLIKKCPPPIVSAPSLQDRFVNPANPISTPTASAAAIYIKQKILPLLPLAHQEILQRLSYTASLIASSRGMTKMDTSALVICLAPSLLGSPPVDTDSLSAASLSGGSGNGLENLIRMGGTVKGGMKGIRGMGLKMGGDDDAVGDRVEEEEGNTVAGVLMVCIDSYDQVFSTHSPPSPIVRSSTPSISISSDSESHPSLPSSVSTASLCSISSNRSTSLSPPTSPPRIKKSRTNGRRNAMPATFEPATLSRSSPSPKGFDTSLPDVDGDGRMYSTIKAKASVGRPSLGLGLREQSGGSLASLFRDGN